MHRKAATVARGVRTQPRSETTLITFSLSSPCFYHTLPQRVVLINVYTSGFRPSPRPFNMHGAGAVTPSPFFRTPCAAR